MVLMGDASVRGRGLTHCSTLQAAVSVCSFVYGVGSSAYWLRHDEDLSVPSQNTVFHIQLYPSLTLLNGHSDEFLGYLDFCQPGLSPGLSSQLLSLDQPSPTHSIPSPCGYLGSGPVNGISVSLFISEDRQIDAISGNPAAQIHKKILRKIFLCYNTNFKIGFPVAF